MISAGRHTNPKELAVPGRHVISEVLVVPMELCTWGLVAEWVLMVAVNRVNGLGFVCGPIPDGSSSAWRTSGCLNPLQLSLEWHLQSLHSYSRGCCGMCSRFGPAGDPKILPKAAPNVCGVAAIGSGV